MAQDTGWLLVLSGTLTEDLISPACKVTAWCATVLVITATGAGGVAAAQSAPRITLSDAAKFMAGIRPTPGSQLISGTGTRAWRRHARNMNSAWARLDKRQLSRIRTWSQSKLPGGRKTLLYMFSGPDFLYANSFFPNARTYIFAGLEPIGRQPDFQRLSNRRIASGLAHLRSSINTVLNVSFFRTKEMRVKLTGTGFKGILPVLYVFMARAGKDIEKAVYVKLLTDGRLTTTPTEADATGVRIAFTSDKRKRRQVLYYFRTDVSNAGLKKSGFLKFLDTLGPADSFVKSASYLMHRESFSTIRNQLLAQSTRLLQDDSGIPLRHFKRTEWSIRPYGRYTGPIPLFANRYQRDMARLFRKGRPEPIRFGIGYRWRPRQSSFIVAKKK